jgi:exodeoxyribonuclease VII small subunit
MARKQPSQDDASAGSGETPSFEQAMGELETLVERMEQGEISLEESLKAFERGRALVDRCKAILDDAERRIEQMGLDSLPGGDRA